MPTFSSKSEQNGIKCGKHTVGLRFDDQMRAQCAHNKYSYMVITPPTPARVEEVVIYGNLNYITLVDIIQKLMCFNTAELLHKTGSKYQWHL
jgi:hypothetical protein